MQADLNRLIARPPADKRLAAADTPNPIRAKTGLERKQAGEVESDVREVQSTDGLFTFTVRVVKS